MSETWKTLSRKSILQRPPWLEVFADKVELPDEKIVQEYFHVQMPQYTAVFAITKEQKVMMMRCYRHAVGDITLTMPGGMLEDGESPLAGMKREFLEETGYESPSWTSLGAFVGNSTRGCGTYHLFFAREAYQTQDADSGDLEELELLLWDPDEVENAINQGKAKSLGVITMLLLGLRQLNNEPS